MVPETLHVRIKDQTEHSPNQLIEYNAMLIEHYLCPHKYDIGFDDRIYKACLNMITVFRFAQTNSKETAVHWKEKNTNMLKLIFFLIKHSNNYKIVI